MKILSVNAGSSSLKFSLIKLPEEFEIASGLFERISLDNSFYKIKFNDINIKEEAKITNHEKAINILIEELLENKVINSLEEIEGIGHRVVHGGEKYIKSVIIDDDVIKGIEDCSELAPLHNPANLTGIKAFLKHLPNVTNVAVFDTAFHQTMKQDIYLYPIPYDLYTNYGIRKYGFHGTSHKYINQYISKYLKKDNLKVISCHLGNGSSITAIDSGQVVDTSMGFTPLAGLMMGTRSGDIDPGIIEYLMKKTNKSIDEVMHILNKESGLLGISGLSSDSRDVEIAALDGDERSNLAEEICSNKIVNYIAMYNNLLNGADIIAFTAGIGENSKLMRERVLDKLTSLNIAYDKDKNDFRGEFRKISTRKSKIEVYVIPTNEELMIALETYDLIKKGI